MEQGQLLRQPTLWLLLTALFWILNPQSGRSQCDLSILEIASPKGTLQVEEPVPVQFTVKNIGADPSVKGEIYINIFREVPGGDPENVYQQSLFVNLDPGETVEITRPDWTPLVEGEYTLDIYLFASNDGNFSNNQVMQTLIVEGKAKCTELRPTRTTMRDTRLIPNLTDLGVTESETVKIEFTTEGICCWNLNATQVKKQGEGTLTLDSPPSKQITKGVKGTYSFRFSHTDLIDEVAFFQITFTWNRCDSPQVSGSETLSLYILPRPDIGSRGQKTTAATPAAGKSGDPVNTATGELYIPWSTDLAFGGPAHFSFRRYYGSNLSEGLPPTPLLGTNWTHNYAWELRELGEIAMVTMPSGRNVIFEQSGNVWQPRDRYETTYQLLKTGDGWVFGDSRRPLIRRFDTAGRLQSISDRNGNRRTLTYQNGKLARVSDGIGRQLTFTYNGEKLEQVGDGTRTVRYSYQGDNLTGIVDPRGNNITIAYDPSNPGLITAITRPEGNKPFSQTFDTESRVATQTDGVGNMWSFDYAPGETTITYPDGGEEHHYHSEARELREREDQLGNSFDVLYDDNGRRTAVIDRLGDTTKITYHAPSGNIASITDAEGATTSYTWSEATAEGLKFYDLTAIDFPDGTRETREYNAGGNLTSFTDREGNRWSYSYNARGQVTAASTPEGEQKSWFYNGVGQPDSVVNADGSVTQFGYDPLDRILRRTSPDGSTISYTYDANNNLTSFTDPAGEEATYSYDKNNRLISLTNKVGGITTFSYDNLDRPKTIVDPEGVRTERLYDQLGNLSGIVNGVNDTVRFEYDRERRITAIVDAEGNRLRREVDPEGVTRAFIDQLGNRWEMETDNLGQIVKATDPLGITGETTYDELGRVRNVTDGQGREQQFSYDERGLLTGWDYPGGIATSYQYSSLGYLTKLTDPLNNQWGFEQDERGRLIEEADPLGNKTAYQYDELNRLSKITMPGDIGSTTFQRDARGLVTELRYSDGTQTNFTYDANGRTISGDNLAIGYDKALRVNSVNGIAVRHDNAGRISAFEIESGKSITYEYDRRNFLTTVTDWLGGKTTFTYDATGKLSSITRPNGLRTNYEYDAAGRLVRIEEPGVASINRTLDSLGRARSVERTGYLAPSLANDSAGFAYDAASQVAAFNHDQLGRIVDDGARTYSWNIASQVEEIAEGGSTTTYRYDGVGNVVEEERGGEQTKYLWNYALSLPSISADLDATGAKSRYYVHTPSGFLLYAIDAEGNARHFYHYDEVGTTTMLSNDAGEITDRYTFTPYGRPVGREGETENRYTFVGAWGVVQESESGLYRMRARLYDASTTRFISRDPARLLHPKQVNPYRYAMGNPLQYIDVTGAEEEGVDELYTLQGGGESPLNFLGRLLYSTSAPPIRLEDPENTTPSTFDEENLIELGDGEHVFGSGDIAKVLGHPKPKATRVEKNEEEPISDVLVDPATPLSGPLSIGELARLTREESELEAIVRGISEKILKKLSKLPSPHPQQPRLFVNELTESEKAMQTFLGVPYPGGAVPAPPLSRDDNDDNNQKTETKREAPDKMVIHPLLGIPVPESSLKPPPLTLDEPEEEFIEENPIELGDGEEIL
ncbi:MAG: RHS repeat-associated core domain-containing protein [Candidatus Kapaibacterium sp.]